MYLCIHAQQHSPWRGGSRTPSLSADRTCACAARAPLSARCPPWRTQPAPSPTPPPSAGARKLSDPPFSAAPTPP
eukprot:6010221-Pyramimonas_sp.AAC.1